MRFKAGDRVRVKTWDELIEEGYKLGAYGIIVGDEVFTRTIIPLGGKEYKIESVDPPFYSLKITDEIDWYNFTEGMLAPVIDDELTNDTASMMTYEKASDGIKTWLGAMRNANKGNDFANEFIDCAEFMTKSVVRRAINKQIPKKPIAKHYEEAGEHPYIKYSCPNCNKGVSAVGYAEKSYQNRFCHKCGQAIDWSEEE